MCAFPKRKLNLQFWGFRFFRVAAKRHLNIFPTQRGSLSVLGVAAERHRNIVPTTHTNWNRRSSSAGIRSPILQAVPPSSSPRFCFLRLRQSCSEASHIYFHDYALASVSHGGGQASFESSRTTYSTPGQRPR